MSDSREFLFKAVRKDNGEWVEGDLIGNSVPGKTFIQRDYGDTVEHFEVYFHTVCQFWRMLKDGVRLFSGDVLVTSNHKNLDRLDEWREEQWGKTTVLVKDGNFSFSEWCVEWGDYPSVHQTEHCRVVGNIHDTGKEKDVSDVSYAKFVDILVRQFSEATGLTNLPGLREKLLDAFKSTEEKK